MLAKQPGEAVTFTYDFGPALAGDTISAIETVDPGATAGLAEQGRASTATTALVRWAGGVDGVSYQTVVRVRTAGGDLLELDGTIQVQELPAPASAPDPFAAALAAISAMFAEPIIYTGAGLIEEPIVAIKSDAPAGGFNGRGATLRQISFEVAQVLLPSQPEKRDMIQHKGSLWRVTDITRRDDVAAWELVVTRDGAAQL